MESLPRAAVGALPIQQTTVLALAQPPKKAPMIARSKAVSEIFAGSVLEFCEKQKATFS